MKEIEVAAYDDLDWAEKEARTRASCTVFVGLDGKWAELDLTEEHTVELAEFLARYMKAGRKPEQEPRPSRGAATSPGRYRTSRADAIERNRAMLAFAQEHGLKHTPSRHGSGTYFPAATIRAYEEHVAKGAGAAL